MSSNELAIPFAYAGEVYAAAITLPIVAALVVGFRFHARQCRRTRIGWDDWSIFLALLPLIGMGVCLIYGTAQKAIGYPSAPYPVDLGDPVLQELTETTWQQDIVFRMDWVTWLLMIPCNGLIKLSALFLYRRVFVVQKNTAFDVVSKIVLVLCSIWTVGFWFAQLFGCGKNFRAPFQNLLAVSSCNTNVRLDALMISDLVTDIVVWAMPIPMVWGLQLSIMKELSLTGVFCLAAVSLAAAIVRLIVQEEISNGGYAAHTDVNLTLTILLYWSMIESGLALIAACLPTLHLMTAKTFFTSAMDSFRKLLSARGSRGESAPGPSDGSWTKLPIAQGKDRTHRAQHELTQWSDGRSSQSAVTARAQGVEVYSTAA